MNLPSINNISNLEIMVAVHKMDFKYYEAPSYDSNYLRQAERLYVRYMLGEELRRYERR